MLFTPFQIITQQQLKHLGHPFGVLRQNPDQTPRRGIHRRHPHHVRVIFTETFAAVDGAFRAFQTIQNLCLFPVGIGKICFVLALDLIKG